MRRILRPSHALLLVAPMMWLALAWSQRWVTDDAFINFRVVDQIVAGNGPVFNAGERVEAATSPLWLWILTVGEVLPGPRIEWFSVIVGIALSVFGLYAAERGIAALLSRDDGVTSKTVLVPVGALLPVALAPFWDFASSGLETGLTFAWIGGCLWAFGARRPGEDESSRRRYALAALAGLGPLIRPDLALFSLPFLATLLVGTPGLSRKAALQMLGVAVALPVVYEVFRLGYYGLPVPSTAVAKEASHANWAQGWAYLRDLVEPYKLWIPALVLLGAVLVPFLVRLARRGDRPALVLIGGTGAIAAIHALYVIRVGGDFMHGRLLLPSLFALCAVTSVVAVTNRLAVAPVAVILVWALVAGLDYRPPIARFDEEATGITDERHFWSLFAENDHPVTLEDFAATDSYAFAQTLLDADGRPLQIYGGPLATALVIDGQLATDDRHDRGISFRAIGITGYAVGTSVRVIDPVGLADAVAAHIEPNRDRVGHIKNLPDSWMVARFGDLASIPGSTASNDVRSAQAALQCGELRDVLDATEGDLTPGRFFSNMVNAFSLSAVRYPADPKLAAAQLCGATPAS